MTVGDALRMAERRLAAAGIRDPRVDAELLLAHVIGTSRSGVRAEPDREVDGSWEGLVRRREAREPLAYVLGQWGFRRLTLRTDRRALVPRPETEITVERCLALLEGADRPRVLDVGTGTGAIALALADEHPGALVTSIDASQDALELARENAGLTGLEIELAQWDLDDGLPSGPWDLVVSNPPYVREVEIEQLAPEVRDWEPRDAILDRGQTEVVSQAARAVLRCGGFLVVETHWDAARKVAGRLEELGYDQVTVTRDLTATERVVEGRWTRPPR